jgi:hypothetical protein
VTYYGRKDLQAAIETVRRNTLTSAHLTRAREAFRAQAAGSGAR